MLMPAEQLYELYRKQQMMEEPEKQKLKSTNDDVVVDVVDEDEDQPGLVPMPKTQDYNPPIRYIHRLLAIKRFFDSPTKLGTYKKFLPVEYNELSEEDKKWLGFKCAEALGFEVQTF